jgi:hypothetical protein
MNQELLQSIQDIFSGNKTLQCIGTQDADHYVSKEYLEECSLICASAHKHLYNIVARTTCAEIKGLKEFINRLGFKTAEDTISGCFYYPVNGFMGWHTNHTRNDWRMYIVNSIKGDSFFRYVQDDKIITEMDPMGWSYRIFYVGDASNLYWHCVHGGSGRYSIGFRLKKF